MRQSLAPSIIPSSTACRDWLERGYAGEMAWMARTPSRAADVRNVVPGARSVIVTGTLYNTDRPYSEQLPADVARISRYAWGDDYHDVLKERLDALLAWMREQSAEPFEARAYVDTGPVQERVYAQYAGLGWIGKNTCLINPELGSWLFLGEIICTLDLEPDTQGLEQCGSCTRCLEACPTGALRRAGVLDSTALHLLPDDRASRQHSRWSTARRWHARLRLRHLPGGVSLQPSAAVARPTQPGSRARARSATAGRLVAAP